MANACQSIGKIEAIRLLLTVKREKSELLTKLGETETLEYETHTCVYVQIGAFSSVSVAACVIRVAGSRKRVTRENNILNDTPNLK